MNISLDITVSFYDLELTAGVRLIKKFGKVFRELLLVSSCVCSSERRKEPVF